MKKKSIKLSLAVAFAAIVILSACSGSGNNSLSADAPSGNSESSSTPIENELIASDAESSSANSLSQEEEDKSAEEPKMVRIDADGGLRMRGGPGADYDIIKVIPQNACAEVTAGKEDNPDWLYVSYDGDCGWVSKEFVSYELNPVLAAEYNSTSWAKVYHDYLSTFEPVTYTSTMYGSTHTVAGRMTGGGKIACMGIEFRNFDGYAYPVLICWDGDAVDADGNMAGVAFDPNVYLVDNEELILIDYSSPKRQAFMLSDGYLEPKGSLVVEFSFKPENGGDPENIKKALTWLETQM